MLQSTYSLFRFTTMFRGGMISLIYERTLRLKDSVMTDSAALSLSKRNKYPLVFIFMNINSQIVSEY